jgi:hypothetical protein
MTFVGRRKTQVTSHSDFQQKHLLPQSQVEQMSRSGQALQFLVPKVSILEVTQNTRTYFKYDNVAVTRIQVLASCLIHCLH